MSDIKEQLVRLGAERPDLRKHIRPILAGSRSVRSSGRTPRPLQVHYNAMEKAFDAYERSLESMYNDRSNYDDKSIREREDLLERLDNAMDALSR